MRFAEDKQFAPFAPKGGVMDGAPLTADQVRQVSKWPTRQEQLSILMGQILVGGGESRQPTDERRWRTGQPDQAKVRGNRGSARGSSHELAGIMGHRALENRTKQLPVNRRVAGISDVGPPARQV